MPARLALFFVMLAMPQLCAAPSGYRDWNSSASVGSWQSASSWTQNESPATGNAGYFGNNTFLTSTNNSAINWNIVSFEAGASQDRTVESGINLTDWAGGAGKIDNKSSATHTINGGVGLNGGSVTYELNPVSGNLVINGGVNADNAGKNIHFFGANTVTINGGITGNAGNGITLQASSGDVKVILNDTSGYTGNTLIDRGTLTIGGSISSSSMVYLGNGGNANSATLVLSNTTTFGNALQINTGDGTRTVQKAGANAQTMSGVITNNKASTFDVSESGGALTASGVISGSGSITKAGSGTLVLSGASSNSVSGGMTVSAGTLIFNKSSGVNAAGSGNITINAGGTVRTDAANQTATQLITVNGTFNMNGNSQQFALAGAGTLQLGGGTLTNTNTGNDTFSGQVTGTGGLVKAGAGTLRLTGTTSTFSGTTTLSGGLLAIDGDASLGEAPVSPTAGKIVIGNASLGFNNSFTLDADRGISLTDSAAALNVFDTRTVTYDGTMAGSGTHGLNKTGGGTLILGGNNNYTGLTTVSNGVVRATHANAFGTAAGGISVVSGAGVELSGGITIADESLTLVGTGIGSAGALRSASGSNAYTGLITASTAATYIGAGSGATLVVSNVNSGAQELWVTGEGTTIVSGGATNSGGGAAFVKTNTGTAVLMSANTWSGDEYIRQGTVIISNNNALGVGGTTFIGSVSGDNTATLTLGSGVINSNAINIVGGGGGTRTLDYQTASGTGEQKGNIALNNSAAFNVASSGTLLFSGTVTPTNSGDVRLALDGGGTLISTGNSTTTGANYQIRVGNGTLILGSGALTARTGVGGIGHGYDLGVDLNNAAVNATSSILASNGVSVVSSIYVSTTGTAARVLGLTGSGQATFSGAIDLTNAGLTVTADNAAGNAIFSGVIGNFAGSTAASNTVTKTGAGTVTLSGDNTYGGATTIAGGTLRISGNNRLGNTSTTLTISNAGILEVTAAGTITNAITIGAGNGVLSNTSGGMLVFAGTATKDGTVLTSRSGSGTNVFTGVIQGTSANSDFVVDGGTTVFSNVMTYNGPTIITNDGTLALAVNNATPSGSELILGGGTLLIGDSTTRYSTTFASLTLTADSTIDMGAKIGSPLGTLTFGNSTGATWATNAILTITNWQGSALTSSDFTEIIFGVGGLTSTQLGQIRFADQANLSGALLSGTGELVPVPEPRVYAAAVALLGAVGWRERKRLRDLLGNVKFRRS